MKFLFLMDPLETVHPHKDTSYALMIGASRRGHDVFYLAADGITLLDSRLHFDAEEVVPTPGEPELFSRKEEKRLEGGEVDAVFIRTDPPFDAPYLTRTLLLDQAPPNLYVINSPSGVRTVNEKIWALQFTGLVPPTLVTQSLSRARDFLAEHGKAAAKPTDGFGGKGVFILQDGDPNTNVIFESLTQGGKKAMIVQKYIPEAAAGDKRILLLNGEPLGCLLRLHGADDHRNNFFAGGSAHPAEVTVVDRKIIDTLAPHLRNLGLGFVGIDVIGDCLIEVNVTSPTCLQEMNRLYDVQLEDRVIEFVEKEVRSGK